MSSIVSFYRVRRGDLAGEGGLNELLNRATEVGDDYGWSGYVMRNLLTAMEEVGVSRGAGLPPEIESDAEGGVVYLATPADKEVIESLDLNGLDEESVSDGLDLDQAELREAKAESLAVLHQLIATTSSDEALVIRID